MKALGKEYDAYPVVAIVGRVNVGKSTLFNKLIGEKKAVVAPVPATTRDANFGLCHWRNRDFIVIDTGGYQPKTTTDIDRKVYNVVRRVVRSADCILFVIDGQVGVTVDDRLFLRAVRALTRKPILCVGNKIDSSSHINAMYDKAVLVLGCGAPTPVSATSGLGVGDLLDILIAYIPEIPREARNDSDMLDIAIVGRTNVGKSSLLNGILGEERVIVSPIEHTTREAQDMVFEFKGKQLRVIDTVGMRKKGKIRSVIDREGFLRSMKAIRKAKIVVLVLDATVTPSKQESRLLHLASQSGSGILLVVNKWDIVEGKDTKSILAYESLFRSVFAFVPWAPILFVSALSGKRVHKVLEAILAIQYEREKTITQNDITSFLKQMIKRQGPQWIRNQKKPVIYGMAQTATEPPTFELSVNKAQSISYAYLRFLENRMREIWGFEGTPVRIHTKQRTKKEQRHV